MPELDFQLYRITLGNATMVVYSYPGPPTLCLGHTSGIYSYVTEKVVMTPERVFTAPDPPFVEPIDIYWYGDFKHLQGGYTLRFARDSPDESPSSWKSLAYDPERFQYMGDLKPPPPPTDYTTGVMFILLLAIKQVFIEDTTGDRDPLVDLLAVLGGVAAALLSVPAVALYWPTAPLVPWLVPPIVSILSPGGTVIAMLGLLWYGTSVQPLLCIAAFLSTPRARGLINVWEIPAMVFFGILEPLRILDPAAPLVLSVSGGVVTVLAIALMLGRAARKSLKARGFFNVT